LIKAVLFDLGGTLISFEDDALHRGRMALYDFLRNKGFAVSADDVVQVSKDVWTSYVAFGDATMMELPFSELMKAMLYRLRIEEYANTKFISEAVDAFYAPLIEASYLLDGALELLSHLQIQRLKLGLVTDNESPCFHSGLLEKYDLTHYFHSIVASYMLGVRKPHHLMFARCLEALHMKPRDAVFIGDRLIHDVFGAQNAGLPCIWLSSGMNTHNTVRPTWVVHSITDVANIIDSLI
jgi:FMN phosphatase YigB (HAD superfamily)